MKFKRLGKEGGGSYDGMEKKWVVAEERTGTRAKANGHVSNSRKTRQ